MTLDRETVARAAHAVASAEAMVIGAGAGMGVDSGLPDFRGNQGFWKAYPPFQKAGLSFIDMANPSWFHSDPELAWGFYGHRMNLYRRTDPHDGFRALRRWSERMSLGAFVFTSNVDGQFQAAGFDPDRVVECHGSIHHLQPVTPKWPDEIWDADDVVVDVDETTIRAHPPLPTTPDGRAARPNILMFGDGGWLHGRTAAQEERLEAWLGAARGRPAVVVECGGGTAIPSVRMTCEQVASALGATLIRINPREPQVPPGALSFAAGAHEALEAIDAEVGS